MPINKNKAAIAACLMIGLAHAAMGQAAAAPLTLNGTGSGMGFTLSTVIGPYSYSSSSSYIFVSVGVNAVGQLIAPTGPTGDTYVFNDVDNQSASAGTLVGTVGPGFAMAEIGGSLYGSQSFGNFYNFNSNGTIGAQITTSVSSVYGLWGDQTSGKLLASSSSGLVEIDPGTGAVTMINTVFGDQIDGVTVSPDGTVAYAADTTQDRVFGFSLVTGSGFGSQIFDSGYLGHGSDGMGVLGGTCKFAGQIVVNNNDGTVGLINPSSTGETIIASGGTRGDYASLDPTNGTLFLSQNDQIARIAAPTGCSIGTSGTSVPEPASLALLVTALLGAAGVRRRRIC